MFFVIWGTRPNIHCLQVVKGDCFRMSGYVQSQGDSHFFVYCEVWLGEDPCVHFVPEWPGWYTFWICVLMNLSLLTQWLNCSLNPDSVHSNFTAIQKKEHPWTNSNGATNEKFNNLSFWDDFSLPLTLLRSSPQCSLDVLIARCFLLIFFLPEDQCPLSIWWLLNKYYCSNH